MISPGHAPTLVVAPGATSRPGLRHRTRYCTRTIGVRGDQGT